MYRILISAPTLSWLHHLRLLVDQDKFVQKNCINLKMTESQFILNLRLNSIFLIHFTIKPQIKPILSDFEIILYTSRFFCSIFYSLDLYSRVLPKQIGKCRKRVRQLKSSPLHQLKFSYRKHSRHKLDWTEKLGSRFWLKVSMIGAEGFYFQFYDLHILCFNRRQQICNVNAWTKLNHVGSADRKN